MISVLRGTALSALVLAGTAAAQPADHAHHGHREDAPTLPSPDPACLPEHAEMGHCTPHEAAKAPDAPAADYADRIWGAEAMAPARAALRKEHGGGVFSQVMVDLAEARFRDGHEKYHWDAEAWFGGDIHRLVVKTAGEGAFGEGLDGGEAQALYSRAIGPYFNLQAGLRQDFGPGPSRTYASLGFEGLAPYWFEVEGALFLSDKGQVLARIEGSYDQRITQRLILQPRGEITVAAQDMPAEGVGAGLTEAELGLRLRYELAREFAPYAGVVWERQLGRTARLTRLRGESTGGFAFVLGLRAWF